MEQVVISMEQIAVLENKKWDNSEAQKLSAYALKAAYGYTG